MRFICRLFDVVVVGQGLRNQIGWWMPPLSVDGLVGGHLVACVFVWFPLFGCWCVVVVLVWLGGVDGLWCVGQRLRNKTCWWISPLSVDWLVGGFLVACVLVWFPLIVLLVCCGCVGWVGWGGWVVVVSGSKVA